MQGTFHIASIRLKPTWAPATLPRLPWIRFQTRPWSEPCLTDRKIVEISHQHHDLTRLLTSKSLLDQLAMFGIEAEPFELWQIVARALANLQL